MTRRYAERTRVPISQSRNEIERILDRYGADQFIYGHEVGRAVIGFRMSGRQIKMFLTLPKGEASTDDKERRRLWRSLAMIVKAKLEAVASGVSVFDDEFMPHIIMPDGKTVGEHMRGKIALAYKEGTMPKLIPYGGE